MIMERRVAVFVGSLRAASWSRKVARSLIALTPQSRQPEIVEIGQLPLYNQDFDNNPPAAWTAYNQDFDNNPPAAWTAFRQQVKAYDAVLFVTPEYNRSVPAPLKNAIDVGSRPYGKSVWDGKPGAVVSVSPGVIGGCGANHHLRQSLVFLNVPCMPMPEAYVGGIASRFDETGALSDKGTRDFLQKFMTAYATWVERNATASLAAKPRKRTDCSSFAGVRTGTADADVD
jgi:chromate reductase